MQTPATEQLRQFIADNNLKREDGSVLFEATITFYRDNTPQQIFSEVHVITLPHEMDLYIIEFGKEEYPENDVYSTEDFHFIDTGNLLTISNNGLSISVQPASRI